MSGVEAPVTLNPGSGGDVVRAENTVYGKQQVVTLADPDGTLATVARGLTERMFAKAPQAGYALWLDTADVTYIYLAEAPQADPATATTFQGVRVTKDTLGNPLGKVQTAIGFAWVSRATAGWL